MRPKGFCRAHGIFLAAFEASTTNFVNIVIFSCIFKLIFMYVQVLGAALEASECSWRSLEDLLRALGAPLRPLEASWRPLESVLWLPEGVLKASGARSSRHSASPMDPGEGQELRV